MNRSALQTYLSFRDMGSTPLSEALTRLERSSACIPVALAAAAGCGLALGSYRLTHGVVGPQPLLSALKVPLLLAGTAALSVPSYFVTLSVVGLGGDIGRVFAQLRAALLSFTLVLAAFSPIGLFGYLCHANHRLAVLSSGPFFLAATWAAMMRLRRGLRPLIEVRPLHRRMLTLFAATFAFVAIQLAWTLRPFVGRVDEPIRLFGETAFTNAFEALARLLLGG